MNAVTSVLSLVAVRPRTISELEESLRYRRQTVYKALEALGREGLVEKRRSGRNTEVSLANDPMSILVGRVLLGCIGRGVDPEVVLRRETLEVLRKMGEGSSLRELLERTGMSYHIIRRSVDALLALGAVKRVSGRPLVLERVEDHPVGELLDDLADESFQEGVSVASASAPVRVHLLEPKEIERVLREDRMEGSYIVGADLLVTGEMPLDIYMSSTEGTTLEDLFLRLLEMPEGVEDLCPQIVAMGDLDYDLLVEKATDKGLANVLGAYMEVLGRMGLEVPEEPIERLQAEVRGRRVAFPSWERRPSDDDRMRDLEERWNLELRLDMGALAHGVRSL